MVPKSSQPAPRGHETVIARRLTYCFKHGDFESNSQRRRSCQDKRAAGAGGGGPLVRAAARLWRSFLWAFEIRFGR